jgi:hypothetical protein
MLQHLATHYNTCPHTALDLATYYSTGPDTAVPGYNYSTGPHTVLQYLDTNKVPDHTLQYCTRPHIKLPGHIIHYLAIYCTYSICSTWPHLQYLATPTASQNGHTLQLAASLKYVALYNSTWTDNCSKLGRILLQSCIKVKKMLQ